MTKLIFNDVLNDLTNYFILGDIESLKSFKYKYHLSDDLASELTKEDCGDKAVYEGIIIPMTGVKNYPYTIIFNLDSEDIELFKEGNDLQFKETGYILNIQSGQLNLFTWPVLSNFTEQSINKLLKSHMPKVKLENGWYKIAIYGGQTIQASGLEPTFEFLIKKTERPLPFTGNVNRVFSIESSDY